MQCMRWGLHCQRWGQMHLTSSSPSTFVQLVMKLCSTCINMTHSHNVYCSCNPCRDKKCRDKNRMSSLNVFAIFRGFHLNSFKFQDVSRCFKSVFLRLAIPQNWRICSVCSACIAARRCAMGKLPQRRLALNPASVSKWWQIWKSYSLLYRSL